jgi:hypothetical protein
MFGAPALAARYPGELGPHVWAPRGTIEGACPARLASEPVMNLVNPSAAGLTTNAQQLQFVSPGSQDIMAHRSTTRNRDVGNRNPSYIAAQLAPKKPSYIAIDQTSTTSIFKPSLYANNKDDDLISTGVLSNPYTGEDYELFENKLPPGDADFSLTESQLEHINPRLLHMQGGYNHHNPPPPKREHDGSVWKPYSADSGGNAIGAQLYTKQLNDRQMENIIRSTYNNRNGDQVVEPAFSKERPANFVGYVPRIHFQPFVVPTNELDGTYLPPHEVMEVDLRKREQYTGTMYNNKPRVHMKNRVFPHSGPDVPNPNQTSDHIDTQRDGTFAVGPGPDLPVGARQDTNWVLRPTQTRCALPIGMVTGIPLPPTRTVDVRGTSQGPLPTLPTAAASFVSAATTHGLNNPSLRNPSFTLPPAAVTGTPAPASIPITSSRPGPPVLELMPVGSISGPQAAAIVPTDTMREGPLGVGSLPAGLPTAQQAPTIVPTVTMRSGPLGVGSLPVSLPSGTIAPALIPTTMTINACRPGALPGSLATGIDAARVNDIYREASLTRRPDRPLPAGQAVAESLGGNVGTTMKVRDLNQRERMFEVSRTANPGDDVGERVVPQAQDPLAWRGEGQSQYQIGQFSGIVDGSSMGMRPHEPRQVRGRKTEPFTPQVSGQDVQIGGLMVPQFSTVNERTLREEQIAKQHAEDV